MCGICGINNYSSYAEVGPREIKRMNDVLVHRGPDDEGYYIKGHVALGHRRLSIIDLSHAGHQPMANEDETVWLTFNGEIYNFLELRDELMKKGHKFRSRTDSEVIVHAYEEYGERCVEKFNGMFAFAIWDEKRSRLFIARDRLGIKPLFYYDDGKSLLFASEVKALLKSGIVEGNIDSHALSDYLSLGYILAPKTILKGVKKLLPGHYLILEKGTVQTRKYWNLSECFFTRDNVSSEKKFLEGLEYHIKKAVKRRMLSDVPLGSFLSGGVDSSTIASFMARESREKINTFSIGFNEASYDETSYSQEVADFLGTEHNMLIVSPDISDVVKDLIWYNDEPLGDSSTVPMYYLCEMTRKKVTVALSGDGADENMAGYETYIADLIHSYYKKTPGFIRNSVIKWLADKMPSTTRKVSLDYKIKQFVAGSDFNEERAHYWWRVLFSEDEKKELLSKDVLDEINGYDPFDTFKSYYNDVAGLDFLSRSLYVDIKTWLVDDILVKVDRTSMAHSLEVRVPFLDHELVEYVASMPPEMKLRYFRKKYLLKKVMDKKLPHKILHRKKQGFNSPVSLWFKNELKQEIFDHLGILSDSGLFDGKKLLNFFNDHVGGKKDNGLKLWSLYNFALWKEGLSEHDR